jgi:hypothetical protein
MGAIFIFSEASLLAVAHPFSCAVGSGSNAAGVDVCEGQNFRILPDVAQEVSGQTPKFMLICVTCSDQSQSHFILAQIKPNLFTILSDCCHSYIFHFMHKCAESFIELRNSAV